MCPRPTPRRASTFVHVNFHYVQGSIRGDPTGLGSAARGRGMEGPAPFPTWPPWATGMSPHARRQVADRNVISVSGSLCGDPRPADPLPPNEEPNRTVHYPLPQAPPPALLISYVTNASGASASLTGLRFPSLTSWLRGSSRSILQLTIRSWAFLMQTCSCAILWPTRLIFAAPCFSPPCFVLPVYVHRTFPPPPASCPDVPSRLLEMLTMKFSSG